MYLMITFTKLKNHELPDSTMRQFDQIISVLNHIKQNFKMYSLSSTKIIIKLRLNALSLINSRAKQFHLNIE